MNLVARNVTAAVTLASLAGHAAAQVARNVDRPPAARNSAYIGNRAPLRAGAMIKLPVGSFRPAGWLGKALELQRDGLAGHLGEISVWLTRKDNAWLKADGTGRFGWEEVPYWLRGYVRMAYTLNDPRMVEEAKVWIEGTLGAQRESGDFGPVQMKNGKRDLWAQMLMLQVLQTFHEATGDARVVPFMTRYFKWQLTIPDDQFLKDYWENSRGGDNLASVYWLYNRTGDAFLLDLATKIDKNTADWRQETKLPNWHVVNIAECFREPATYWLQSGKQADLDATYRDFRLVREKYGQVPGGMFGADENARPGHTDPHQAAETCSFVEQIWSNLMLTEITGDGAWAASTEDVAFNSMPAAFTPDYKALRYLTAPNQVISDSKNHAPGVANDGPFFLMNPFSSRCCQHNHSSAWVNYAEHAWMATGDGGLACVLFAEGTIRAKVGTAADPRPVSFKVETKYPFEEEVRFTVTESTGVEFPLYLRIPAWAAGATIKFKGVELTSKPKPGGYVHLMKRWMPGDVLTLHLPMTLGVRTWAANSDCVSVDYGPLTFSLKIDETYAQVASDKTAIADSGWQPSADPAKWPSHEILPASPWNYGLVLDKANPAASLEIAHKPWPADNQPFTIDAVPILLKAKGRRLPQWTLDQHGLAGAVPKSPAPTADPVVDLILVPMGAARLRISAFPTVAGK